MDGLRPLGVGELLDAAIKIYRSRWRTLMAAVAVPVLPVVAFSALVTWSAQPEASVDPLTGAPTLEGGDIAVVIAATLVSTLALIIASSIATAACFRSISGAYLGDDPDWKESLRFGLRRAGPVLGVTILSSLVLFAGVVVAGVAALLEPLTLLVGIPFAIAVGIWGFTALSMAIPSLLVEDLGVMGSLRRSVRLVKGTFWRVFGVTLLGTILASVFQSVISAPLLAVLVADVSAIIEQIVNVAVQSAATVLVTPFTAALTMALYIDLRVRKEGFDLVLLAQRLGADPAGGFPRQPGAPPAYPGYGPPWAPPGPGYGTPPGYGPPSGYGPVPGNGSGPGYAPAPGPGTPPGSAPGYPPAPGYGPPPGYAPAPGPGTPPGSAPGYPPAPGYAPPGYPPPPPPPPPTQAPGDTSMPTWPPPAPEPPAPEG